MCFSQCSRRVLVLCIGGVRRVGSEMIVNDTYEEDFTYSVLLTSFCF